MTTPATGSAPRAIDVVATSPVRAAFWAAVLGIVIVIGAGFAPGAAHNAAHDTRHSFAFPCH